MKTTEVLFAAMVALSGVPAGAASVLFDFNTAPVHTSLPLDLTVDAVTAHFSATGQGFSIQDTAQSIGVLPAGFSGLGIVPNSVFLADLLVSFPQTTLSDFSIMFAPQDLDTDTSATLWVTAFINGVFVGTNTAVSDYQGIWPSGTLHVGPAQDFNSVVVHYDKPPPTGGDYGVIFAADNMNVTPVVLLGDYNHNGAVDAADYIVWRKVDGTQIGYDTWRTHFGEPTAPGTAAARGPLSQADIPEPATLVLLVIAAAGLYLRARPCRAAVNE